MERGASEKNLSQMEERTEWNLFSSRFMYCLTGIGWTEGADDLLLRCSLDRLLLVQEAKNKRFVCRQSETAF